MKTFQYKYKFQPEMYKYVMTTNILNKKKNEHKILKLLVEGYSCEEIGKKCHYSPSTIKNRRKEIYNKTKMYMF